MSGQLGGRGRLVFPITVTEIKGGEMKALVPCLWPSTPAGAWVSIRVVGEEGTRLGVFLGNMAFGFRANHDPDTGLLTIGFGHYNPAIWVPALNRVVYGCQCWWGVISSPEQLRQITDLDIQNVWYVKALKDLCAKEGNGVLNAGTPLETDHREEDGTP